jgi:predicted ATP-dependent Lon-type protease
MEDYINYTLLKNTRNLILAETDKYLLPDYPITSEQLEIVKNYRKSLRDFTNNNYIMPDKPDLL